MVIASQFDAYDLCDVCTGQIQGYYGSFNWVKGYYLGFKILFLSDPSVLESMKYSWLFQGDRVGTETEVKHFKAECTPVLSPVDPTVTFGCDSSLTDVPRPYNPWVRSTDLHYSLGVNSLSFQIVEHLVTGNDAYYSFEALYASSTGNRVTLNWTASYVRNYATLERDVQTGQINAGCSSCPCQLSGSLPPLDWVRSELNRLSPRRSDLQGAVNDAWGEALSNLCMNTNNIANVVQIATGIKGFSSALQKGASLFKSIGSFFDDNLPQITYREKRDLARIVWSNLDTQSDGGRLVWDTFSEQTNSWKNIPRGIKQNLSKNWLEWRFQYNTTKSDFEEMGDYLERAGINVSLIQAEGDPTKIWKSLFGDNLVERSTQRGSAVMGPSIVRVTAQFAPHEAKSASMAANAIAKLQRDIRWNMKKYGFQPNAYNLWDMIPISFMADYIYDFGGKFETMSRADMGDYFRVKRATVTIKTVVASEWQGSTVMLTSFSRYVPTDIPQFEATFQSQDVGSSGASTKTRIMRLIDGVTMLGG